MNSVIVFHREVGIIMKEKREEKEKETETETETETTDHKQVQGTDQQSVAIIA